MLFTNLRFKVRAGVRVVAVDWHVYIGRNEGVGGIGEVGPEDEHATCNTLCGHSKLFGVREERSMNSGRYGVE